MAKKTDQKTLELIREVKRRKEEISKAERPVWITNCSFSYSGGRHNDAINIHVEANVQNLVLIAAFLRDRERSYNEAAVELGAEAPPFTWGGFKVADWLEDLKARLNKIQIASKKKKLEELEARLNAIISPELRAQLELEAISSELV